MLQFFDNSPIRRNPMAKLLTNVGVFVGFLNQNKEGKILLRRRTEEGSIIPGVSFKGNWELPGGGAEEAEFVGYNYMVETAFREAAEEVGISCGEIPFLGPLYSAFFKGPKGYDLALVVPYGTIDEPTKGETTYVSPEELEALALAFLSPKEAKEKGLSEATGLLSGKGKRMYLMAMTVLAKYSPNTKYRMDAEFFLRSFK